MKQIFQKIRNIFTSYNNFAEKKPAISTIISTGVILSTGDILMQCIEQANGSKRRSHNTNSSQKSTTSSESSQMHVAEESFIDARRVANMALYGVAILGPLTFYWYARLLPRLAPVGNDSGSKQLIKKVLLDQLVGNPVTYSTFLLAMTVFAGKSLSEDPEKIWNDFIKCVLSDMLVWPWVQFVNFKYVPIHNQAVVVNLLSVFWNAYISNIHHDNIESTDDNDNSSSS